MKKLQSPKPISNGTECEFGRLYRVTKYICICRIVTHFPLRFFCSSNGPNRKILRPVHRKEIPTQFRRTRRRTDAPARWGERRPQPTGRIRFYLVLLQCECIRNCAFEPCVFQTDGSYRLRTWRTWHCATPIGILLKIEYFRPRADPGRSRA